MLNQLLKKFPEGTSGNKVIKKQEHRQILTKFTSLLFFEIKTNNSFIKYKKSIIKNKIGIADPTIPTSDNN